MHLGRLAALVGIPVMLFATSPGHAANAIRISQVYGGGGMTGPGPLYQRDYVELFNSSGSPVDISGWAIEYGGATTGPWGALPTNIFVFPTGTIIQSCSYLLVASYSTSTDCSAFAGDPLPLAPDFDGTQCPVIAGPQFLVGAINGKVALFTQPNANVPCASEIPGTLVDKVAYGTANCPEGFAAPASNNASVLVRNNGGMADTDNNAADFTVVAGATPRNSSSPAHPNCPTPTSTRGSSWGQMKTLYR